MEYNIEKVSWKVVENVPGPEGGEPMIRVTLFYNGNELQSWVGIDIPVNHGKEVLLWWLDNRLSTGKVTEDGEFTGKK